LVLAGITHEHKNHPSQNTFQKGEGHLKKTLCAAICVLLLAACFGCSAETSDTPAITDQNGATPEQEGASMTEQEAPSPTPEPAPAAGKYVPGTYTVTVRGMGGKFDVVVTFDADAIVSIEIPAHHETENIGTRAIDEVIPAIIEAQSTEVDAVSGATITSNAILSAVSDAIAEATP
jgi:uncharacterized protein with FMN-binding domain